jgi:hypothetical protein
MHNTYKTPRNVTKFQKKQYKTLLNADFTYLDWTGKNSTGAEDDLLLLKIRQVLVNH